MRSEYPDGGVQDQIVDLRNSGYSCCRDVSAAIGVTLSGKFIVADLGIKPGFTTKTAMYWSPEQVRMIRRALIAKLQSDEATDCPSCTCAHLGAEGKGFEAWCEKEERKKQDLYRIGFYDGAFDAAKQRKKFDEGNGEALTAWFCALRLWATGHWKSSNPPSVDQAIGADEGGE